MSRISVICTLLFPLNCFSQTGVIYYPDGKSFTISPAVTETTINPVSSYTLTNAATISAGVYKSDSTLIRTLFNNERQSAGIYTAPYWDGTNDSGIIVPDGNYEIRILSNNVQYQWLRPIGNTSVALSGKTIHGAAQMITNMTQVGNNMYFAVGYNEGKSVHCKFAIGAPNIVTTTLKGFGQTIRYLATDGTKVYSAGQGGYPNSKLFITAIDVNSNSIDNLSSFLNGTPIVVSDKTYSCFDVSDFNNHTNGEGIFGLAVQQSGNYLFACHSSDHKVRVFYKNTGAFVRGVYIVSPREVRLQDDNTLWLINGVNNVTKYNINSDGTLTASSISLTGLTDPLALAVSQDGTKIAVADRGVYHQVKIYNTSNGALISTIGRAENYSNPNVFDDKFYFNNTRIFNESDYGASHCFLQYQSDGSLWIGDYGNMRCQHFNADGNYIDNIQYMGYSYSTQADINNPTRVFSDFLEFQLNYYNNSWQFVRNWGKNISIATVYDADRMRSVATLSNGRTYALYKDSVANNGFELIELDNNSGIRHTNIHLDNRNCELNPDGSQWEIGGNQIGQPTFWKRKPLTGFDGSNNPIWGNYTLLETTPPINMDDPVTADGYIRRCQISSAGVIASFCNNTPQSTGDRGFGYHLGGVKNGKWVFKTSLSTRKNYYGAFPANGDYDIGNGVNNAGEIMQTVGHNIFWNYRGEFWKGGVQTNKWNHFYDNGLMIGQFGATGELKVEEPDAPYQQMASNTNSGTFVTVGDNIYLFHCDEGHHAGIHWWKINGLNTIQEQKIAIVKNGVPNVPVNSFTNLMAGLPYNLYFPSGTGGWTYSAPSGETLYPSTNYVTYGKTDKDVYINTSGYNKEIKVDLGNNNGLSSWKITGQLQYNGSGEYGSNFIELLDNNDRVILRIAKSDSFPNKTLAVNNTTIATGNLTPIISQLNPFTILRSNSSNIIINYGGYIPVTTEPFDSTANISNPKTIRIYLNGVGEHKIDLANLKFYDHL